MKEWLLDHLEATAGDVELATAACLADFDDLDDKHQRHVIRVGLRDCLARAVKSLTMTVENDHKPDQIPLSWSVPVNGRWTRISYLRFNLHKLRQARAAEAERHEASSDRLVRMDIDIELYERNPSLPDVEAVYLAEGVEYRVEAAQ